MIYFIGYIITHFRLPLKSLSTSTSWEQSVVMKAWGALEAPENEFGTRCILIEWLPGSCKVIFSVYQVNPDETGRWEDREPIHVAV